MTKKFLSMTVYFDSDFQQLIQTDNGQILQKKTISSSKHGRIWAEASVSGRRGDQDIQDARIFRRLLLSHRLNQDSQGWKINRKGLSWKSVVSSIKFSTDIPSLRGGVHLQSAYSPPKTIQVQHRSINQIGIIVFQNSIEQSTFNRNRIYTIKMHIQSMEVFQIQHRLIKQELKWFKERMNYYRSVGTAYR